MRKELKEISKKITKAFERVEIKECTMCGAYLSGDEYKQFEGVCKKHWDY